MLLPRYVGGFLGRWTFAMTHLYLFFAELVMKSGTSGVIVVHRAVVQTVSGPVSHVRKFNVSR
jgi:hypothetical protein